jgi:hypothetical protein
MCWIVSGPGSGNLEGCMGGRAYTVADLGDYVETGENSDEAMTVASDNKFDVVSWVNISIQGIDLMHAMQSETLGLSFVIMANHHTDLAV